MLGGPMTTLLDHAAAHAKPAPPPAQRLRSSMAGVRVAFTWLGVRKTLTPEQRAQAAEPFDAEGPFLSAAKKLSDTKPPAFRAVTAVRGKIGAYWKSLTLPYPEPGLRLIPQERLEAFAEQMTDFKTELDVAVTNLDRHYSELKAAAAERLGRLFCADDYPASLAGLFDVQWDFPSVEPPDYLMQLSPALYEQERARVAARFEEAVQLAEQAFLDEFSKLVGHLCERISNDEGKVFRDSAVNNLVEFFERFRMLDVRSNAQLDELVVRAQRAVRGVAAQDLRDSPSMRQRVGAQLGQVQSSLDQVLIDPPLRRIVRARGVGWRW